MIVVVPTPPMPSREAVDLGNRIAEAVRILRQENPAIRPEDVRRGLQLAEAELRAELGGPGRSTAALVALLGGTLVAGLGVFLATTRGTLAPSSLPWIVAAVVSLLAIVAGIAVAARR